METCVCIGAGGSYYLAAGAFILFFLSICFHHQAFYQIFKQSVRQLDRPSKKLNSKKNLIELAKFHVLVKKWVLLWWKGMLFYWNLWTISVGFLIHLSYMRMLFWLSWLDTQYYCLLWLFNLIWWAIFNSFHLISIYQVWFTDFRW